MTIYDAIFSSARQPLLGVLFLLMTLQMALLFAAFRDGRSLRVRTFLLLHFLLSFAVFYVPMLGIDWKNTYPDGSRPFPDILYLPVSLIIFYEIVTALVIAAAFWSQSRYHRSHLTSWSIKETMDLLPAGIAFGKPDGTVVLSNLTMNDLARSVTGKGLTDLAVFHGTKEAEPGRDCGTELQLTLPGGATWLYTEDEMVVSGEKLIRAAAADITKQAKYTKELEEKNSKLRELHMRLSIYNKQAGRIIMSQELLTARMAVHNEVGNVLLETRHYLQDPASFEEEKLLQALRNTNTYLLREYEEDDTARDPLADSLELTEAIGVDAELTGMIPQEDPDRKILAAAVSECASNTVKHADGDQLKVVISRTDTEWVCVLQNNGLQPKEAIRESGGLLSLRTLVEKEGGSMQTRILPEYAITIRLPK